MKITNRHMLPEAYVRAVSDQREHQRGRISVTELINPPQMRSLELQFWDDLEADAADQVQRFLGTAAHERLAKHAPPDTMAETTLEAVCLGWTVHGTFDDWTNGRLVDYKTTTVRGLRYDKPEWERQLNLYALLCRINGGDVSELMVEVLLRDWEKFMLADDSYPRQPIVQVPVPLWQYHEQYSYLESRVKLHKAAARGFYAACTDEDRWSRGVWAITKAGNTRATRTFDTEEEARLFAASKLDPIQKVDDWYSVEYRAGQPLRCLAYCSVAAVCAQHADWLEQQPKDEVLFG